MTARAEYPECLFGRRVSSLGTLGRKGSVLPAQGIAREHLSGFQLNLLSAPGHSGGPSFCPVTGKVFGVLQGGPVDPKGNPILPSLRPRRDREAARTRRTGLPPER